MPRNAREQCESKIYHIFIRGVGRQLIFEDDQDRNMFLELIARFRPEACRLFAWALMGNHAHMIIQGDMECVSPFMQKLETTYSGYFNRRHDRAGHLFQGRFGSEGIKDEQQLLTALRYVHQNPLRAGMSDSCDYMWSSYREYISGSGRSPAICDVSFVLGLLGNRGLFEQFHREGETASLMDIDDSQYRYERMSDAQALRIAQHALGEDRIDSLAGCLRADRDAKLRLLKEVGLSIRQIARLTGIGRGIIQRS